MSSNKAPRILVLGIGNVLMGDEGVGVHVVRLLEKQKLPPGVVCLDGGTGGFHLLDEIQRAGQIFIVDATVDGAPLGTLRRLRPSFSSDYPTTLCAHDIGLKDMLDSLYLLGTPPNVTLYAVSISLPQDMKMELSPELEEFVPGIAIEVLEEVESV